MADGKDAESKRTKSEGNKTQSRYAVTSYKAETGGEGWAGEAGYFLGIGPWEGEWAESVPSEGDLKVLSYLEAGSVISLLEDLLDQIVVLRYVIAAPVVPRWGCIYRTLEEKFATRQEVFRMFPEVDSIPVMTTFIKLQRDRNILETLLSRTLESLLEDSTFDPLIEGAKLYTREFDEEAELVREVKYNVTYLADLIGRVNAKWAREALEESERDDLLHRLQNERDDVTLICEIEQNFNKKWERARGAQNRWLHRNAEKVLTDKIDYYTTEIELERKVTDDMQSFIKTNQLELEEDMENWMTRYDEEMETRENKIITLKYEREQQLLLLHEREVLVAEREQEMREWIEFREERKRQIAASIIVQAWWRAMMVRKKIGPFKPRKDDKKK